MADPEFGAELAFALELADESDQIAMRWFSRDPDVSTKVDGTLVTIADREIEQALRRRIHDRFPADAVLGEEGGLEVGQSDRLWILDPIDGTNNYAWGIPIFGTLIGMRAAGRPQVGVVSAPALQERYDAAAGLGARMNGAPSASRRCRRWRRRECASRRGADGRRPAWGSAGGRS